MGHHFLSRLTERFRNAQKVVADTSSLVIRWQTIGDPDAPPPTSEPGMEALFKEIRVTVSQEAQIIKAVFPNPSVVMQVFLQRVFAQVVSLVIPRKHYLCHILKDL